MKKHFKTAVNKGRNSGVIRAVCIGCVFAFFCSGIAFANGSDDFNDSLRQFWKWRWGIAKNSGRLKETGVYLEYATREKATSYDEALRFWTATRFPFKTDWDIQIDLHNSVTLTDNQQVTSFGIKIYCLKNPNNSVYAELYSSHLGNLPQRSGFYAQASSDVWADTGTLSVVDGAVRISFDSAEKIITVYCDNETADGYQWIEFGSFGVAGAGGSTGSVDWGLAEKDRLGLMVYGFSSNTAVSAGEMYADNFKETGGRGLCSIVKR
jgi:hypothetical protein